MPYYKNMLVKHNGDNILKINNDYSNEIRLKHIKLIKALQLIMPIVRGEIFEGNLDAYLTQFHAINTEGYLTKIGDMYGKEIYNSFGMMQAFDYNGSYNCYEFLDKLKEYLLTHIVTYKMERMLNDDLLLFYSIFNENNYTSSCKLTNANKEYINKILTIRLNNDTYCATQKNITSEKYIDKYFKYKNKYIALKQHILQK